MFTKQEKLFWRTKTKNSNSRELFRNPQILIFDEPTSSLDKRSTKIIEKQLKNIKEKTIIIVSHNLDFLSVCERIILLKEGKIFKEGSHNKIKQYF